MVKPADKVGNIVVLNKEDYRREALRQLTYKETYIQLEQDPIQGYSEYVAFTSEKGSRNENNSTRAS